MRRFPPIASEMVLPALVCKMRPRHSELSSGRSTLQRSVSSVFRINSSCSIIVCNIRKSRRIWKRLRSTSIISCRPSSILPRRSNAHSLSTYSIIYPLLRPLIVWFSNVLLFLAVQLIFNCLSSAFNPLPCEWEWTLRPATT
jgi:hypothetical protein